MESFLSLETNKSFQNCKDSLIAGKDNSWAFFRNTNQLTSYQNLSSHVERTKTSSGRVLTHSDKVFQGKYKTKCIN